MLFMMASCVSTDDGACTSHTDANGDGKCDACGTVIDDGSGNDGKVTYTVTVKNSSGAAVSGVEVNILEGKISKGTGTTDGNGVVTFKINEPMKAIYAQLISVPDGYELDDDRHEFEEGKTDITITLSDIVPPTVYTVTVKDTDGAFVSGVEVYVCGTVCATPERTDENGCVSIEYNSVDGEIMRIKLKDIPAGYKTPEAIDDEGYMFLFGDATEYTVILEKE